MAHAWPIGGPFLAQIFPHFLFFVDFDHWLIAQFFVENYYNPLLNETTIFIFPFFMLTFKCTKKVQDYLGIKPEELVCTPEQKNTLLGACYVNQLTIYRRKVFLFMNEKTLLSFVSIGVEKSKNLKEDFPSTFLYHFFALAKLLDFPLTHTEQLFDDYFQSEFRRTDSKSALGNMNDLAFLYQHYIMRDGGFNYCDLSQTIIRVNQTPQRNLGWKYSVDIAYEILSQSNRMM